MILLIARAVAMSINNIDIRRLNDSFGIIYHLLFTTPSTYHSHSHCSRSLKIQTVKQLVPVSDQQFCDVSGGWQGSLLRRKEVSTH